MVGDLPIENGDLPIENGDFIYWLVVLEQFFSHSVGNHSPTDEVHHFSHG